MNNKKAIKSLKEFAYTIHGTLSAEEAEIILKLIEKLQKANKKLTKSNKTLSKIVDSMTKHIYLLGYYDCLYEVCDDDMDRECFQYWDLGFTTKQIKNRKLNAGLHL